MMNETEQKGQKYLIDIKGYNIKDINFQPRKSPDFITLDKGYEVKLKYGNIIWFSRVQYDSLRSRENIEILVFDRNSEMPVLIFPSTQLIEDNIIDGIRIKVLPESGSTNMMILDEVYEKLTRIKRDKDSYGDAISYLITRDEILDEVSLGLVGTVVMIDTQTKDELNFLLKLREGDELFEGTVKKFLVRFKDDSGLAGRIGIGDVAVVIGYTSTDLVICYDLKGKNGEMCPVLDAKYVINMKKAEGLGLSGLETEEGIITK